MTHLDPSSLASYNSLVDPHLQSYFNNERIQSHLQRAGLISRRGEIFSESEYRSRIARREHRKHVRHMLAENIIHRAVDMERVRHAEMRREIETVSKAALVNNIKESKKRAGNNSGLLSIDSSWAQIRPQSAVHQDELYNDQIRIPRAQSAHVSDDDYVKNSSKSLSRRRRQRRSKSSKRTQSSLASNSLSSSSCEITMVYFGPHTKVDYDHLVFEAVDEIIVMQQHCGGENLIVYKNSLKPGAEFVIHSRRHSDYPLGLSLYINGLIDSRISTCCEYKHRHGVKLGGDRGHFAIKSVQGSQPCIKCRFEKQARLKKYAQSPKEKDVENKKPIIISIPVSDQPKIPQTPVKIPVRLPPTPDKDSERSDKPKQSFKDNYSSDSSFTNEKPNKGKTKTKTPSPIPRKESSRKSSSTVEITSREDFGKKTWQIIFHSSDISTGNQSLKDVLLKFSFLANDQDEETEVYEIDMKQIIENSKQYSLPVKLKNIGKPEHIRLKLHIKDDDDDDDEVKWHLDHIELIDPETQSHSIFPCKQWIRPFQEKILQLSQKSQQSSQIRRASPSSDSSRSTTSKDKIRTPVVTKQNDIESARSSPPPKFEPPQRTSPDIQSNHSEQTTPRNDTTDQENRIRYNVTIYPSKTRDGEFVPISSSRIFLRVNNQRQEIDVTVNSDRLCPTFRSGEEQTFQLDLIQHPTESIEELTIGYVNSDNQAGKWNIDKIILINNQTGDRLIFPCHESLIRNDSNFRAEKTLKIQSQESDHESTPRNAQPDSPKPVSHVKPIERSPSFDSMNDDEADYKKIFRKLDPENKFELGSLPRSPTPRQENSRRHFPTEQ